MRKIQLPKKLRRFLIPGVLLLSLFLLAGGLYFHSRSLNLSSQSTVIEKEEGGVAGVRTDLPQSFPQDIPLFEPSEILSSLESQGRIQITLQTEASAARVLQFYQQEMKDLDWRLTGRGMANDNGVLTFIKNGRHTQLIITSEPDGPTLIILGIRH